MKITIIKKTPLRISETELKKIIKKVQFQIVRKTRFKSLKNLNLVFVSAKEMLHLQKKFRNKNRVTDILSFSPNFKTDLGDLVFCVSELKKQSQSYRLSLRATFAYLLIHGILHLLGFDHEKSLKEAQKMYKLQDEIFESLKQLKK